MGKSEGYSGYLIGIDTNVIARYVVQDDRQQADIATAFLESLDESQQGYISVIVLVELVWLLKRGYKQPKATIIDVIYKLVHTDYIQIENKKQVLQALTLFQNTSADFADALIATQNAEAGCDYSVTFDKGAAKHSGMTILS